MKTNTEITLPVAELKALVPGINKVIARRSTLPVLGCVRVESNLQSQVTLQVTDLDCYASVTLKETSNQRVEPFLMPWDPILKAVKGGSNQESIVLINEGKKGVKLRTFIGTSAVDQKLEVPEIAEWPPVPVIAEPGIALDSPLRQAIQEAFGWSSEDQSRYILQTAYLDVEDKRGHYVVSTNGRALFSSNSFNLDLKSSLIVPNRRFLNWDGAWEGDQCRLSYQPGKENPKTKAKEAGWVQLKTDRWTFITKEIEGNYPRWKQVVPRPDAKWTSVELSEAAIKQMIQVIPKLPGDYSPNYPIRLRVGTHLFMEGQDKDQKEWTSIAVEDVRITGKATSIALNREYLLKALGLGLNRLQIADELTPVVFTKEGKTVVVMPVRLEVPSPVTKPTPPSAAESKPSPSTPETEPSTATNNERTDMTKASAATNETVASESAIKAVMQQIEKIKDTLKGVVNEFNDVLASLKTVEKEKKATEKEIESIRSTLRSLQRVQI